MKRLLFLDLENEVNCQTIVLKHVQIKRRLKFKNKL